MADLRVLIVDDEPLARRGIRQMLAAEPDVVIVAECRNGVETLEALRHHSLDLVFLDVQMPDLDGFDVIRHHGIERMPSVVFVTAYDTFAVRAFEARALDYLVKPLNAARFAETMSRVRERRQSGIVLRLAAQLGGTLSDTSSELSLAHMVALIDAPAQRYDRQLVVVIPGGQRVVEVETIDWIEADDYYARLHIGRSRYLLRESLAQLMKRLDPTVFLRVHRSAIVRLDRVRSIARTVGGVHVLLHDGTRVRVSRRNAAALRARIRQLTHQAHQGIPPSR